MLGAPDAAAQLIQIRQAETIGAINDNGVGVWNIQAAFDNRGADQNVDFSADKAMHRRFQFIRIHLAMAKFHPGIWTKIGDAIADLFDCLHPIVQEKNLALSFEFAIDRVANDSFIVTTNDCFDRKPVLRWRFDCRHVFHTD